MERDLRSPVLVMRIIKIAFLVSALLFIRFMMMITVRPHASVSQPTGIVITVVAFACIVVGFFVPRLVFRAAEHTYQSNPALTPLKRWMTKGIMSLAYFEACILFGLVLHYLGSRAWLVGLLFGAGILAMLIWSPGKPPGAEDGDLPQS